MIFRLKTKHAALSTAVSNECKATLKNERGATMVEFAISLGVFLIFLGAITDLGLSLHRKSMLTHLSKEVSRLIAIRLTNSADCSEIALTINNEGRNLAENRIGVPVDQWQVAWHGASNANTYPSFNLSLASQAPCFFLCNLFPNGLISRSSIESAVSRQFDDGGNLFVCPDITL